MRNHLFTIYIFFICLSWPDRSAKSQTIISGIIINDFGETVIGANVLIQDSYDGTSTDLEGKYSFTTTETGTKNLQIEATFSFLYLLLKPAKSQVRPQH